MRNDPEVKRAVDRYQMGIPNSPISGRSGELLGRGTGSSLEFQEHRQYLPGDDIRHLDWAAYARTDSLMVRLYREEISPRTQVILDVSRSMNTGFGAAAGIKSLVSKQLAAMFGIMISALGARPSIFLAGSPDHQREIGLADLETLDQFAMEGVIDLGQLVRENALPLKTGTLRIVISDWMFPHDSASLIRRLAHDSSMLWGIQVLNRFEDDPQPVGGRKLVDVESRDQSDLMIDHAVIDRYRSRLHNLKQGLQTEFRRCKGNFTTVIADDGLDSICLKQLCEVGMLRAA